ncbi:hypothetical protein M3215_06995 [Bacillus cytotoxicus]|uniref:Uncharacterized protein n=1 Tax=Bacillus cytotoxicus TaxID=580165 RepID=A0ACC6A4R2_9BACI|nr:hypothetical protein [Bacillus cytotoxicus]
MTIKYDRLHDLVLPKDVDHANKLTDCMLKYMNNAFTAETSEKYERWCEEFDRCAHEFLLLRKAKEEHEVSKSYCVVIKGLQANGVNASLVKRKK